jgi:hypothetical protein
VRAPPPDPRRFDLHDIAQRIPVTGGYTPVERCRVVMRDGRRAFLKRAIDADTAGWIRTEARVYDTLEGAAFLPTRLDYVAGPAPTLWLEDLGAAHWPGAWRPGDVAAVQRALAALHAIPIPDWVAPMDLGSWPAWSTVAVEPGPLLALGLVTARWLEDALPHLLAAERSVPSGPSVLSHMDVRSDNLCIRSGEALLVDWNWICAAPAGLDAAFWAPSLAAEGGGRPEDVAPPGPTWPARVSGFFAAQAGLPDLPLAPRVRHIQQVQLRTALPWAVRVLGLPALDGPQAPRWPNHPAPPR